MDFVKEDISINLPSKFQALEGLKILHISDFHFINRSKRFDRIFAQIQDIDSDFTIISGDMIDDNRGIGACAHYLGLLKPRYGVLAGYGNHDRHSLGLKEFLFFPFLRRLKENNISLLRRELENKGINVLDNVYQKFCVNGVRLDITGIEGPFGYDRLKIWRNFDKEISSLREFVSRMDKDSYKIVISHLPDIMENLKGLDMQLMLSGHTHGGQIRLPFIGPLVTISSFQRKYNRGLFKFGDTYLHVNSGLGTSGMTPFRVFCPPTASLLHFVQNKTKG
ncbi:MAG: metallophosphoesterase [Candidatus Omnitrophica bacterium]|nr:metallophosphoesterase [Candidatus Omnitrophota bacterium]